jgi:hypothetical protein
LFSFTKLFLLLEKSFSEQFVFSGWPEKSGEKCDKKIESEIHFFARAPKNFSFFAVAQFGIVNAIRFFPPKMLRPRVLRRRRQQLIFPPFYDLPSRAKKNLPAKQNKRRKKSTFCVNLFFYVAALFFMDLGFGQGYLRRFLLQRLEGHCGDKSWLTKNGACFQVRSVKLYFSR